MEERKKNRVLKIVSLNRFMLLTVLFSINRIFSWTLSGYLSNETEARPCAMYSTDSPRTTGLLEGKNKKGKKDKC
jgi:hypothetical protein